MTKIQYNGNNTRLLLHYNTTTSIDMLYRASRHVFGDVFNQPHGNSYSDVMSPWITPIKRSNGFTIDPTKKLGSVGKLSLMFKYCKIL